MNKTSCLKFSILSLLSFLLLILPAFSSVTVNATLRDPAGNAVKFAYLQFDLLYCGYNVPVVPGVSSLMVQKSIKFTQSQLPGTIYGNDEITCGNSYSTLWHVTAYLDSSTPVAGDANYVICSAGAGLTYCPNPSGSWDLSQSQPFTGNPPPPGFQSIFGNPSKSQTLVQPNNTSFFWYGTVDFTHATVIGLNTGGGSGTVNPATQYALPYYVNPGSDKYVSGVAAPTTNGTWFPCYGITASSAVAPSLCLPGVPVNAKTNNYTLAYTDRGTHIRYSAGTTATLTLPAAAGSFASNMPFSVGNFNSGALSLTPTSPNNIDGGNTQAASTIPPNFGAFIYQDSSSPINWWSLKFPLLSAFPNCVDSGGNHLNFTTSTGLFSCGTSGGGGGGTPGGSTTQFQFNNSGSFAGTPTVTYTAATTTAGEADNANLNKVRVVTPFFNWSQTDVAGSIGNLAAAGSGKTLTLTPCPIGVDTSNNTNAQYAVYVSGTGTAEAVPVTGGTCTSGAASGTIIVTTQNTHSAGFTVGSASTGIQEAYNDAAASGCCVRVELMPDRGDTNLYFVYSTVWLTTNKIVLTGYGARVITRTRDRGLGIGPLNGGNTNVLIAGMDMQPGINVDGVLISSVKDNSGRLTVTTASAHPFVNNDWVILFYSVPAVTAKGRFQVNTGTNCVNGSGTAGACLSTEFEYLNGASTFASSSGYGWVNIENTAIEDISDNVRFQNVRLLQGGSFRYSWGVVIGNDQSFVIDGLDVESGSVIQCQTANFCGAAVYLRGDNGASPIGHITNSNISVQCGGNGVRDESGNGLLIDGGTVIQGFAQYGVYYGGGLQNWTIGPYAYEEVGACPNRSYPQGGGPIYSAAGYISGGPKINILDNAAVAATFPVFVAQNPGAQQNNYFIVIKSGGQPASPALYIGSCSTTGTGNCTTYWPEPNLDSNSGATITYDLLKTIGTSVSPPYTGNAQSVTTAISRGAACTASTGICTFVDTQGATSAYTMNTQSVVLQYNFWPCAFLLSNGSKAEVADSGGTGFCTTTYLPSVTAQSNIGAATSSKFSPSFITAGAFGGGSILRYRGNGAGAGTGGLKGLVDQIDFNGIPQGDLYTLGNSNIPKTLASPGYQPSADANDTAIGFDHPNPTAASSAQLAFRAPSAISMYIGSLFDNSNFKWRVNSTSESHFLPNYFFGQAIALAGSSGFGPLNLSTANTNPNPYTSCLSGAGANMTSVAGSFTYSGGTATWATGDGGGYAISVCTPGGVVFTPNQSMQVQTTSIGAGQQGLVLRGSNVNYTRYEVRWGFGGWSIFKCNSVNTCSSLNTGVLAGNTDGCCYVSASAIGTSTVTITANYYNFFTGVTTTLVGTDNSSTIASGYPGIEALSLGAVGNSTATSQDWTTGVNTSFTGGVTVNTIQSNATTFANLPSCAGGTEGTMRAVTDSTTSTWGATITGAGANHVLAYCDGTNWTVAAK